MKISVKGLFIISLIIALLSRTIIFLSSPFMVSTSDSGSWISFAIEIHQAGMIAPHLNTINYPGSEYIYPPVIPFILMLIYQITGSHGLSPFYIITILEILVGGISVVPVFLMAKEKFGSNAALFSSIVYGLFSPFLYLISFSGLPQEAGFLIILCIVYLMERTLSNSYNSKSLFFSLFLLSFILNFIHDLSAFFFLAAVLFYFLYTIFSSVFGNTHNRMMVYVSFTSLLGSLSGFLVWYLPRIRWIVQGISIYGSSANISSASSILISDLKNLAQPVAIPTFMGYLSVIFPLLALFLLVLSIRSERGTIMSPLTFFLFMSFILTVISAPFPVIFVRLSYFLALFYSVSSGIVVAILFNESSTQYYGRLSSFMRIVRKERKKVLKLIMVFIILYSVWGIAFSYTAHTYYLSENHSDFSAVKNVSQWILTNEGREKVIAASQGTGYFIMGYTGNPVIDYVNQGLLSQSTEINESIAAHMITACPLANTLATFSLIEKYNVSLAVTYLNKSAVPGFYSLMYTYGNLRVYSV